jgi:catechol 2,3-dioxygenase-like lactoylglutathione lyase family enzyme
MLADGGVAARLPAQDLQRARVFYAEKLGLEPGEERPGGLLYQCARGEFALFESDGAPSGSHTQMAWQVDDIEAAVAQLKARGVLFEQYDSPGLTTQNDIAQVDGNYTGKGGVGERAAWFKDSEGNLPADQPADPEQLTIMTGSSRRLWRGDRELFTARLITISGAEHIVTSARMTDPAAAQKAAYRRHAAAKGLLTKARKDGGNRCRRPAAAAPG